MLDPCGGCEVITGETLGLSQERQSARRKCGRLFVGSAFAGAVVSAGSDEAGLVMGLDRRRQLTFGPVAQCSREHFDQLSDCRMGRGTRAIQPALEVDPREAWLQRKGA
jgi:hypothetical protein